MARIDIPFVVEKQQISQPTREKLVAGGKNYFYATFKVNDTWDDIHNIKAVFVRSEISKLMKLTEIDGGYECKIPWEVMVAKGVFSVGIFGGDTMLTNMEYVEVKEGCVTDGEQPSEPTPDWFSETEAILKDVSEKAEEIDALKSDVEGIQQQINEESHFRGYVSTDAKVQSLEATPNDFAYSAESGTTWIYDAENGWQDTGIPVPDQLTPPSDTTPLMNGKASTGLENAYARGDHRHPTDTTRASVEALNDKVDKEDGKGLSTNDFTDGYVDMVEQAYWEVEAMHKAPQYDIYGTLSAGYEYILGEVDELNLAFPTIANDGDVVYLTFKSGATPTALTIDTTNTCDIECIPEANTGYEIFGKFNGDIWIVNYSEYTVSEV